MNKIDKNIIITGIICLTAIQIIAMFLGINGTFRTIVAIVIAAAIGINVPSKLIFKK